MLCYNKPTLKCLITDLYKQYQLIQARTGKRGHGMLYICRANNRKISIQNTFFNIIFYFFSINIRSNVLKNVNKYQISPNRNVQMSINLNFTVV